MKHILFLLCTCALAALAPSCCNTEAYEAQLQTWVNRSKADLVSYWGPPEQEYSVDGSTKVLVYRKVSTHFSPGRPASWTERKEYNKNYKETRHTYDPGSPDSYYNTECKTLFTLKNNKVISWKYEGEDCCG